MELKEIDKRLSRLGSMVESWRGKHSVANIERDMALEELRRLYDAILDYSAEQGAQPRSVVRRPVVVDVASKDAEPKEEATEGSSSVVVEFDDALDIDALLGITPDTEEKPVEVVATEEKPDEKPDEKPEHKEDKPEEKKDNPEAVTPQSPEVPETPQAPQTPQSPETPEERPVEEAKDEKPADEPAAPTEEHKPTSLFDLDDIPVRSRSGRKMVQLYSDGYTGRTPVDPKPDPDPKPKAEPDPEPKPTPKPTPKPEPKPQSVAEVVAETKTVRVADVLGGDVTTLGDKMASDDAPTTPFNKIASLRQAIGINDKFQMIRDLFAGDAARYEATIETLDEFDDLDECMIYIVENFHWNPDSEGAKLLVSLIERKLA